jgi:hypothetical protein
MIELAANERLLDELQQALSANPRIEQVLVSRRTLRDALTGLLEDKVNAAELVEWANLVEQHNDEIAYESGFRQLIADFIFRLSTPEINKPIDKDLCRVMIDELATGSIVDPPSGPDEHNERAVGAISAKHRVPICLLSVGMASGLFLLLGLHRHTAHILGRWYFGVSVTFALFFAALVLICLRGRFSRARWMFPVCIAISYAAAIAAYLTYFSVWEHERTIDTLKHFGIVDFLTMLLFGPTIALVWVFGALVGICFLLLQRSVLKYL